MRRRWFAFDNPGVETPG